MTRSGNFTPEQLKLLKTPGRTATAATFSEILDNINANSELADNFQTIILENVKGMIGRMKSAFIRTPNGTIIPSAGKKDIGFKPVFVLNH